MLHQDSMGNRGDLRAGGAQWMKAAAGVIHSEMPQQSQGLMRGFQLWINLPAREKMTPPEYQEFTPEAIPEIEADGARIRILAGEHAGNSGVIQDPFSKVKYLDVRLSAHSSFTTNVPSGFNAFAYVFEGDARSENTALPKHSFVLFGDGESVTIHSDGHDTRFILVAGQPLNEPIVQYGPFVMNTRAEIEQAFADFQSGKFARIKADVKGH
jgi:redox-sensitive bicupin YhaK (pirin superfamily)